MKTVATDGKLTAPLLTAFRNQVFGPAASVERFRTLDRAERMRDDAGLLAAAEVKRKRKLEKRRPK